MNRLNQNDFWDGAGAFGAVRAAVAAPQCWSERAGPWESTALVEPELQPAVNHTRGKLSQVVPQVKRSGTMSSAIFRGAAISVPLLLLTLAGRARDGAHDSVGAQWIRDHHQSHYSL